MFRGISNFKKIRHENLKFNFLKGLNSIFALCFVFISYNIFDFEIYSRIQVDYGLYAFSVLLFSLGFYPVAHIISRNSINVRSELYITFLSYILILLVINFLIPKSIVDLILMFYDDNIYLIYFWPILISQNFSSFIFLGEKKYILHFMIPIINIILLIIGLYIFYLTFNYSYIFLPSIIYSVLIIFYLIYNIDFTSLLKSNFFKIYEIWKINYPPVLSSMLGVKNIHYFIIQFFSNEFYGIYKLINSIFNIVNFFILTRITLFVNNNLKKENMIFSKIKEIINIKKEILYFNIIFLILIYFINNFFISIYDFSSIYILLFAIINIFSLVYLFDNNIMFIASMSKRRLYCDLIALISILLIFYFSTQYFDSQNNQISMLSILIVFILNFFVSNYIYYLRKVPL